MAVQTSLVKEKASYGVLQKRTSTLCKQKSVVNQCRVRETTVPVPRVSDFYVWLACPCRKIALQFEEQLFFFVVDTHLMSVGSLTHTHTHTHTHRHTQTDTDRHTHRQTHRQTDTQADTHTETTWETCSGNLESWEPSQHLLLGTGKPRKTCVKAACRSTFRILTASQQSGI